MLCDISKANVNGGLFNQVPVLARSLTDKGIECSLIFDSFDLNGNDALIFLDEDGERLIAKLETDGNFAAFSEQVFEYIKTEILHFSDQTTVKLYGLTHNRLKEKLWEIEQRYQGSALMFCYSHYLDSTIKVLTDGGKEGSSAVSEVFLQFNKYIYAEEDVSLSRRLIDLLKVRGKVISVAESLTGGQIAAEIIKNAGASEVFYEGIVAYSNDAKTGRLSVDGGTITKYGAVSSETAYEMASGLLSGSCDVAISTTGIAGPGGGTLTKPVGLTYIAVGTSSGIHVYKHVFSGSREDVRVKASNAALFYAVKRLKDNSMDYDEIQIN